MTTPPPTGVLEIRLRRFDADGYSVELRSWPSGSDAYMDPVPGTTTINLEALSSAEWDGPAEFGQALTERLFADPAILEHYKAACTAAEAADAVLRVRLYVDPTAPELHALKWELLHDPQDDQPLATRERILFSRFLGTSDWRPVRLRSPEELRALVVIANPSDLDRYKMAPVDVEGERQRAAQALAGIPIVEVTGPDTFLHLVDHLRDEFDILYLVGHGTLKDGEPILWLESAVGVSAPTPGRDLADRLGQLPNPPRLVVLASCRSAGTGTEAEVGDGGALAALGPRLAEAGIPAVLAMQGDVSMTTVARFMPVFFRELRRDGQIERAAAAARFAVRHRDDAWVPVLFHRLISGRIWSGDDDRIALRGEMFSVEGGDHVREFFSGVQVTALEFGAGAVTDDHGVFSLQLPSAVRPGQEVTLRHDKTGYAICSPLLGKQLIPADPTRVVEIRMLPAGSKLFWTHERIEEFIARTASESVKQLKGPQGGETDLSSFILELARHYGFTADEVRREIGRWMEQARKDLTDSRKQGMVAFAAQNFRLAGENFRRHAEQEERQAAEHLRESAKVRALSGDSFYNAMDFQEALKQYRIALRSLTAYHDGLGVLGLKVYPEYTVEVQEFSFKFATAKAEFGLHIGGPGWRQYLEQAVQVYMWLIEKNPRSSNPQGWATIQNNLGNALTTLGERLGGAEGAQQLVEAVEAFHRALAVYTRNDLPQQWAMTQNNLGNALASLGERLGGTQKLVEAVEAFRRALAVYTRDALPQDWAMTQNNLGTALVRLGERLVGIEGARRLVEAVEVFRQALAIYTRDAHPQRWAMTQINMGSALRSLGERVDGTEEAQRLIEAVEAFRRALAVYTRDDFPQQWATTQTNLGNALANLGERLGGAGGARWLVEATEAYRQALTVLTREDLPQQWAMTQNNLGNVLRSLGELLGGAEGGRRLIEAVEAYRQSLTVRTRDVLPYYWVRTWNNLGLALQTQILISGVPVCLQQIDHVSQEKGVRDDPVTTTSLHALTIVCQVGLNQDAEASRTFSRLVALVEHQPDDFHLAWDWDPLREFLYRPETAILPGRRETLRRLVDAVSQDDREAILAGLKEVQGSFTERPEEPSE